MTNQKANPQLYKLIKNLKLKDTTPLRLSIFDQLRKTNIVYHLAYEITSKSPWLLKSLYLFSYSVYCLGKLKPFQRSHSLCIWENKPELKAVLDSFHQPIDHQKVSFSFFNFFRSIKIIKPKSAIKFYKLLKVLSKKESLLISLRTSELIIFYSFYKNINSWPEKIYFSSDASPFVNGIMGAKPSGTMSFYTPHGIVPKAKNLLYFDQVIFRWNYNQQRMKHRSLGECKLYSLKKIPSFKLSKQKNYKIGIICSIIPNTSEIERLYYRLENLGHMVLIKKHPNMISKPFKNKKLNFTDNLNNFDIVYGANSGHCIKILEKGIPVVAYFSLDYAPKDIYELAKDKILYEQTKSEVNFKEVLDFYQDKKWLSAWSNI